MVEGGCLLFYALVTNITYPKNNVAEAFANSRMTDLLPIDAVPGVRGSPFFSIADLNCLQIIEPVSNGQGEVEISQQPFDTIPRLLSKVRLARQDDLSAVFRGTENWASWDSLMALQIAGTH